MALRLLSRALTFITLKCFSLGKMCATWQQHLCVGVSCTCGKGVAAVKHFCGTYSG